MKNQASSKRVGSTKPQGPKGRTTVDRPAASPQEPKDKPIDDGNVERTSTGATATPDPEDLASNIQAIHESHLTWLRTAKASLAAARTTGDLLHRLKQTLGEDALRRFVQTRLNLSCDDAAAYLKLAEQTQVQMADFSPANAMKPAEVRELLTYITEGSETHPGAVSPSAPRPASQPKAVIDEDNGDPWAKLLRDGLSKPQLAAEAVLLDADGIAKDSAFRMTVLADLPKTYRDFAERLLASNQRELLEQVAVGEVSLLSAISRVPCPTESSKTPKPKPKSASEKSRRGQVV